MRGHKDPAQPKTNKNFKSSLCKKRKEKLTACGTGSDLRLMDLDTCLVTFFWWHFGDKCKKDLSVSNHGRQLL